MTSTTLPRNKLRRLSADPAARAEPWESGRGPRQPAITAARPGGDFPFAVEACVTRWAWCAAAADPSARRATTRAARTAPEPAAA